MICKNPFVIKLRKNHGISHCDLHELAHSSRVHLHLHLAQLQILPRGVRQATRKSESTSMLLLTRDKTLLRLRLPSSQPARHPPAPPLGRAAVRCRWAGHRALTFTWHTHTHAAAKKQQPKLWQFFCGEHRAHHTHASRTFHYIIHPSTKW